MYWVSYSWVFLISEVVQKKKKKKMRIQLLTYYQEPQGDQGCVGLGPNWLILQTTFAL